MKRAGWLVVVFALAAVAWERGVMPETFSSVPPELRHKPKEYGKTPVYFDCGKDVLTIQPGGIVVSNFSLLAMSETNSPVRQMVEYVEANSSKMFLMVLQRPDSAKTFEAVYRTFYLKRFDVAHELVDAGASVADAAARADFTLGALARPLQRMPVMFECRSNQLFYVSNNELARAAAQFLERYQPMSSRADIELAERAMTQKQIGDEHYLLDGPPFIMGTVRLLPRPGAAGMPVANLTDLAGKFLKRLRMFDPERLYVQFLVRDDSFEIVRQARAVAEKEGYDWRVRLLKAGEALEFQTR